MRPTEADLFTPDPREILRHGSVNRNINKLYLLGDYETEIRTKEDLRIQTLATSQHKKLLQRVHKLERRLSKLCPNKKVNSLE